MNDTTTEVGPCCCDGCRYVPDPTPLVNGLCQLCRDDGCPIPDQSRRVMFPQPHAAGPGTTGNTDA